MNFPDPAKLLDALKLSPRILLGVAIATGVALFAPIAFLKQLGLENLVASGRGWIGAAFLISAALFLAYALTKPAEMIATQIGQWSALRKARKSLKQLSPQEKRVLKDYLDRKESIRTYQISDGVVQGLYRKQILYLPSSVSVHGQWFAYNIQTWAYEHLTKQPQLLEGLLRLTSTDCSYPPFTTAASTATGSDC